MLQIQQPDLETGWLRRLQEYNYLLCEKAVSLHLLFGKNIQVTPVSLTSFRFAFTTCLQLAAALLHLTGLLLPVITALLHSLCWSGGFTIPQGFILALPAQSTFLLSCPAIIHGQGKVRIEIQVFCPLNSRSMLFNY